MSKVASYLQEHILGEVSTHSAVLKAMSTDASVLEMTPEMVIYPRLTSDIRKVSRFAWQLAEKGHVLPLTARGGGFDATGAAIGTGIVLSLPAHMNRIFELDAKQKLVRLQPGVTVKSLHDASMLHGLGVPALPIAAPLSTVGGAVANNATSPLSGRYGDMRTWVHQLEIVLANGDVLQTERISRRELNKRKGRGTFEGEIYRNLDNLIEDNKQLIEERLMGDVRDNTGYSAISQVKQKDGSFDLTPLFIGSQGTLGVISEMILRTDFVSMHTGVAIAAFTSGETARDILDQLEALEPTFLEYYDGELFTIAKAQGKTYDFYKDIDGVPAAVIAIGFDDFNDRARQKKLKKVHKLLSSTEAFVESADGDEALELLAVREVTSYVVMPATGTATAPAITDGVYVPRARFEDFTVALAALAAKHHIAMPFHSRVLDNSIYTRPTLQLSKVADKQKIFKILEEYSALVDQHGGHLIADDGEGRLKAKFAYQYMEPELLELFTQIKAVFDPYGILNPGVKQDQDIRQLVSKLRSDYDMSRLAQYVPYS